MPLEIHRSMDSAALKGSSQNSRSTKNLLQSASLKDQEDKISSPSKINVAKLDSTPDEKVGNEASTLADRLKEIDKRELKSRRSMDKRDNSNYKKLLEEESKLTLTMSKSKIEGTNLRQSGEELPLRTKRSGSVKSGGS